MTPAWSADQQRAFESEVLAYFRSSFHDYCERVHRDPGLDLRGTVIQAQLITVHALRHVAAEIRRQANTFGRRLVQAERVDLRFPVQPQLPAPGYLLEIPGPGCVLRLFYGAAANWEFPLTSGPNWVPLGRSLPAQRGSRGFVIPETMLAVPRGVLLEVRHLLGEDGLFLLHTIGGNLSQTHGDPWADKYIFPNGMLPSTKQLGSSVENLFVIEDWHNFGAYYDTTLMAWLENFERAWPTLKSEKYDERFYRMWRYYLCSFAGAFRARAIQLWQVVLSPNGVPGGYTSIR